MTDFERLVKQLGGNPDLKPGEIGISDVQTRNAQTAAAASKPAAVTSASTGKTNWAKLLGGTLLKGADEAVSGVTSTVNNVIGEPAQEVWYMTGLNKVFGDTNPITKVNEIAQKSKEQNQQYFGENASKSKVAQLVDEYGTATAAAIPMAAVALMTAGSSLGAQATTAGLEATSAAAQAPGLATTISTGLKTMAKDPNYWTAYLQTAGNSYDTAKKDGASDLEASAYGMVNGLMNALVEVGGGGIQELPKALRNKGTSGVREWVKTMFREGKENVVQGVIERGLQNVAYGKRNLTEAQKTYLIGKEYEAQKQTQGTNNQYVQAKSEKAQIDTFHKFNNTAQKVAADVGVAEPTVKRAAQFASGLDAAEAVSPGIKDAVLTGELKTTKAAVAAVAKLPEAMTTAKFKVFKMKTLKAAKSTIENPQNNECVGHQQNNYPACFVRKVTNTVKN